MNALIFAVAVLFLAVIGLAIAFFALARQVGVLLERISPMGALVTNAGPRIGELAPIHRLASLNGESVSIGGAAARAKLLFFISPTCPICKRLLPAVKSIRSSEGAWLDIILASDGEEAEHRAFIGQSDLHAFPYVLSTQLGMSYRVERLPFAVLLDNAGTIRSKGLVNNREQLESLFNAHETGIASIQQFLSPPQELSRNS